jgi:hypothetical protein
VKRTFNLAIIITAVLSLATVALAVAGTSRAPRPTDVPVMVTDRAAGIGAVAAIAGQSGVTASAPTGIQPGAAPEAPGATAASDAKPPTTANAHSSGKNNSGGKKTGGPQPSTRSSRSSSSGSATSGEAHSSGDFEVVRPPVHENDEREPSSSHEGGSDGSSNKGD